MTIFPGQIIPTYNMNFNDYIVVDCMAPLLFMPFVGHWMISKIFTSKNNKQDVLVKILLFSLIISLG